MRHLSLASTLLAAGFSLSAVLIAATGAGAQAQPQVVDRYGGVATYPAPAQAQANAPPRPSRILTWPGKTIPAAAQPQGAPYAAQPAYAPQPYPAQPYPPQQAPGLRPALPAAPQPRPQPAAQPVPQSAPQPAPQPTPQASYQTGYRPQPYYAPAPGSPPPAPGSTATAPSGVYPANTVPPQLAYPLAIPPQYAQPLVTQPQASQPSPAQPNASQPTSIYDPPQARSSQPVPAASQPAEQSEEARARAMAMNMPPPNRSRLYSVHRQFGLEPDRIPAPAAETGAPVELVGAIGSGVGPSAEEVQEEDAAAKNDASIARLRAAAAAQN